MRSRDSVPLTALPSRTDGRYHLEVGVLICAAMALAIVAVLGRIVVMW
ncbi:hypothetical protein NP284_22870 [Rhodopseudomonas pseudopalustris]